MHKIFVTTEFVFRKKIVAYCIHNIPNCAALDNDLCMILFYILYNNIYYYIL